MHNKALTLINQYFDPYMMKPGVVNLFFNSVLIHRLKNKYSF